MKKADALNKYERAANSLYRDYTDAQFRAYEIEQKKEKEVNEGKKEIYDAELQYVNERRDLALKRYKKYKREHRVQGLDYKSIEKGQNGLLEERKLGYQLNNSTPITLGAGNQPGMNFFDASNVRAM